MLGLLYIGDEVMRKNQKSVSLTYDEYFALRRAFLQFKEILEQSCDGTDTWFTNENLSCLSNADYESCCKACDYYD